MNLVKCGKCGAQFNVATMKPGSQFACGKCRSPVAVPAEPTVALSGDQMKKALEEARAGAAAPASTPPAAKAQPKLPPAMQARAQATSASAPTRAAGAAPAAAAPAAPAAAPAAALAATAPKASRKSAGPAPDKKSPAMLYAAIGGVVVVGVIVAMVVSGGDKPKDTPSQLEPPKPVAPPVAVKPRDPTIHDDFLAVGESEQRDSLVNRLVAAGSDIAQLESIHKWVTDPKVSGNKEARAAATRAIDAALKADPNCEWARVARGDKQLRTMLQDCRDSCTKSFQMQDQDEKDLLARLKEIDERPWADAVEYRKYEDMIARIRAREARMAADPRVAEAEKKAGWVRENPIFKGVELTRIFADPYVIFQEVKKQDVRDTERKYNDKLGAMEEVPKDGTSNPSKVAQNEVWAKKGKLFAERDGIIFVELNRRFRELFAERYKLPELSKAGEKGRILTGLVMWNRKSFDTLLAEAGMPVSGGIRAFYSPPQQKIFHYIGDESLQARDEIKCEGGYVQKLSDQVTFHEGTHQLQHEYSAIYRGTPLVDNDTKVDDRKAMWFEEGIAEFMGATEVEETKTEYLKDVTWRHNRILLERIKEARDSRDSTEKWTIKEFLKPNHNGELSTVGQKLSDDGNMPSHFYCRVWGFVHFLWYYDNGKYRPKFYDYLELVMKGTQSSEKFAKLMGRPNVNDWGPIEKEYEWYWQQLLRRKVGRSKVTGQWETPSTDAPTGKVEDDADFLEMWDENHKKDAKK
jgi:DNA-directed RNA polymerase subunit RPC12/RpoP